MAVVLVMVGAGGVWRWQARASDSRGGSRTAPVATTKVVRTDLTTDLSVAGQLGYGAERPVSAGVEGRVTWLPRVGQTVTRGEQLFRVDDQPVALFYGQTPLFRPLDRTGLVGGDVSTVASNLRALGYDIGDQPVVGSEVKQPVDTAEAPGSADSTDSQPSAGTTSGPDGSSSDGRTSRSPTYVKVRAGDAVLTDALRAAIRRWQEAFGADPMSPLDAGSVVVRPGAIRVSSVSGQLGDAAGAPMIGATGTTKVVTASVKATVLGAVRRARAVVVTLPSGKAVPSRVERISRTAAVPDGQDSEPTATVTIVAKHAAALAELDSAPVDVKVVTNARRGVLAVPVEALLALAGGGYGLESSNGTLVAVQVGLIATGLAEVSGPGVTEGMRVVTAS